MLIFYELLTLKKKVPGFKNISPLDFPGSNFVAHSNSIKKGLRENAFELTS